MEWTRTDYIKISPSTYDEVALPLRRKMDYAINVTKMSLSVGGKKKVNSGSLMSMYHNKCSIGPSFILKK